jgi:DNA replication protein DnaC
MMAETERGQEMGMMLSALRSAIETAGVIVPEYKCAECSDTGMVISTVSRVVGKQAIRPEQVARPCECQVAAATTRRMARAGVPDRYAGATLNNFRRDCLDISIQRGFASAQMFLKEAPLGGGARGLLFWGTCGTGKTHLMVAMLRASMAKYGVSGKFWNVGKLLSEIRFTFGKDGAGETERALRRELESVDVLVLDDLGAERSTDWASDQVVQIINDRYDAGKVTHITTNYPNLGVGEGVGRGETLGDRIGARMFSRVQEMCLAVEMNGQDFRRRKA